MRGSLVATKYFAYNEVFIAVGIVYLALVTFTTAAVHYLEKSGRPRHDPLILFLCDRPHVHHADAGGGYQAGADERGLFHGGDGNGNA